MFLLVLNIGLLRFVKKFKVEVLKEIVKVNPPGIYLLKLNSRNTRTRCEICPKLTLKTPERRAAYFTPCSSVFIVNFEQVIAEWER